MNPFDFLSFGRDRWQEHLMAIIIGVVFGGFFSERLRGFRIAIIILIFFIITAGAATQSIDAGNLLFFAISAILAYTALKLPPKQVETIDDITFGSAKWATLQHLNEHGILGVGGFFLGTKEERGLWYKGDRHLLTIAPTRSGKGVSSICPNLLNYDGSVLVIDPKGENAAISQKYRREVMKQKVHIVDPWGITGLNGAKFNPLSWLHADDEDINENAMMLADALIMPHEGSQDSFWDEEAKALLMGILLHVALDAEETDKTLGRVRDIISMSGKEQKAVFASMGFSDNVIVSSAATRTIEKEERIKSSVLSVLQSHTHFLDSPRIRENLSSSDFSFEDLKKDRVTIYLILPADRLNAFNRWLRLLIQQAITVNARNIEIKPDKPVLFLLDEMPSLGRLTMVEQAYSLMAGFGIQLWGIVQDLSQLDRIYGKGWETFIGNSGVLQYFGSRDNKTAEYFSKLCGVTTERKFSFSRTIGNVINRSSSSTLGQQGSSSTTQGSSESSSSTRNYDVVQRKLAFPDELMVMRQGQELVLIENLNPIKAQKVLWYQTPWLKDRGVNLHGTKEEPQTDLPQPEIEVKQEIIRERGPSIAAAMLYRVFLFYSYLSKEIRENVAARKVVHTPVDTKPKTYPDGLDDSAEIESVGAYKANRAKQKERMEKRGRVGLKR